MSETLDPAAAEEQVETSTPAPAASVPEVLPPWADKRIGDVTRKWRDEERARLLAEARLRELEQQLAARPAEGTAPTPAPQVDDSDARAQVKADAIVFNRACDDIARQGNAKFSDFGETIANYGKYLGDIPRGIIEGALETDDAAAAIYALGKDMAEATRIAGLPPARQAAAVVRFSAKLEKAEAEAEVKAPAAPVATPRPPPPVAAKVGTSLGAKTTPVRLDDEKVDIKDWMAQRKEELKKRR